MLPLDMRFKLKVYLYVMLNLEPLYTPLVGFEHAL